MERPPTAPLMPPRKPRAVAGLVVKICGECFRPFSRVRIDQLYCCEACRRAMNARVEARKTEAYHAGMAMRTKKRGGFSTLTNLFDRFIREDAARERQYRAAMDAAGLESVVPTDATAAARG